MSDIISTNKKISKIKIIYEDENLPPEDALIYIPINQVEGLKDQLDHLYWMIVESPSKTEDNK